MSGGPDDSYSPFSNYGNGTTLLAPGVCINSSVPATVDSSGYAMLSGTSMSAGHLAGEILQSMSPLIIGHPGQQLLKLALDTVQ